MCLALQFGCACPLCALRAGTFAAKCACRVVTNTSGRTEPPLLTVTERASLLNCCGVVLFLESNISKYQVAFRSMCP